MITYDLVMIVTPEHKGSYQRGRWGVDHRADEVKALKDCERWNECAGDGVWGYYYVVESHEELCPYRGPAQKESGADREWREGEIASGRWASPESCPCRAKEAMECSQQVTNERMR